MSKAKIIESREEREIFATTVIERFGLHTSWHLAKVFSALTFADRLESRLARLQDAQWFLERWVVLFSAERADPPAAKDDVLLWMMPEDVLAALGLEDPRDPVDAMRASAITFLLELTLGRHLEVMDGVRSCRIAIDLAIKRHIEGALPAPHRVSA